ncbi:MAG: hypothetical protein ABSB88_01580 [Bryobacteraceae bacterium]
MTCRFARLLILCLPLLAALDAAPARRPADARATVDLDELARKPASHAVPGGPRREVFDPEMELRRRPNAGVNLNLPRAAAVPGPAPAAATPVYSGFQGLLDNFTVIPPDTEGAIGPQHLVTMLNSQVLIQSRDGTWRANYPINLGGAGGFWSAVTTSSDVFDPNIRYDATNDRWLASAAVDSQQSTSAMLVGVSQTGDPGGKWNLYKINVGPSGNWGDYPVLGFNGNWVVVSLNIFTIRGNNYLKTTLYVFSRSDLYQNGPGSYTTFNDDLGELIPAADFDDQPNHLYFVRTFAGDVGVHDGVGTIEISQLQGPLGSETFAGGNVGEIVINDAWADTGDNSADFAPQASSKRKIDAGDSRVQNCLLRGGTIWCAHTIFLPPSIPTRSTVQWFQADPSNLTVLQRGRIDDPTNTYFYAYPTIAVNKNADALVGYNRFSAQDYPSAEFSFRMASDPASALEPDVLFLAGQSSYVAAGTQSGSNRWGDFSRTWTDPVDDLTFWTIQEYSVVPAQGRSGQWGTWWTRVTAPSVTVLQPPTLAAQGTVNAASYQGGGVAPGELVTLFGSNLGPAVLQKPVVSASGVVGTVVGGASVLFNGVAAPMVYASAGQVAAVAPFALQGQSSTQVQVSYLGTISNTTTLPVVGSLPGIFSYDSSGAGEGAILNQDNSVNSAVNPAARGSVIQIYATGGGAMPGAVEGTLAQPPYVQLPAQTVSARVGGITAQVDYAGEAPGIIVGVLQINVVVPAGVTPGSAVPVDVTIGGATSKAGVTVAVK